MRVREQSGWRAVGGALLAMLCVGCPADVNVLTAPSSVPAGNVGISVAPARGHVGGGTMVTFTSVNGGFDERTSVLFGEESAADVHVYNSHVMTAVSPPGSPGTVNVLLHAPVDSSLAIMIDEQGAGTITSNEAGPLMIDAGQFNYYIVPPDDGTDTDGDGLTDAKELAGWEVWIDPFGQAAAGQDTFYNIFHYRVESDPFDNDTDDDGLTDDVELYIKSDARRADSDDDGLRDEEEWNQWLTSPTNVDTDGDSRGDPDHPVAPNQALFDGLEMFNPTELQLPPGHADRTIKPRATSPTLADTDGDGASDFDEFDSTVRNGVIADLPLLNYELVGDVDVKLNVEYAESIGQTKEYGVTLTESKTDTEASSFSNTIGWSVGSSIKIGTEFGTAETKATVEFTQSFGVHGEYSWTNSKESSRESSKEVSRVESDSREFTESSADGSIRTSILLTNGGNTTFTLDGLGVLVSKQEKKKTLGDISPPERKTIATMTPVFDSVTLAPGETAGPFELAATGVNAQSIKELMAAPDTLMLGTTAMNFRDSNGLDFDYVRQFTVAQTAHLTIDFGNGEVRQYTVATNVDRNPDSSYRGITLRRVLEDALGLPYGDAARGYTTMANPANSNDRQVLASMLGKRYVGPVEFTPTDNHPTAYWTLVKVKLSDKQPNADFNDLVLRAGDEIGLMFELDSDGDGAPNTLEKAAGTDLNPLSPADADGDGLSDYDEIVKGWVVYANPSDPGMQWASENIGQSSQRNSYPGQGFGFSHPASSALGAPDTTEYGEPCLNPPDPVDCPPGFVHTAWSPQPKNGSLQWIDVRFPTEVYASGVTIRETSGNGFVYQIDASDAGVLRTVWTGTDPSDPGTPENFEVTWPVTDFLTRRIRVYVDTDANPDTWEHIDAIALHGYPDQRARRVFSDPRFEDSDGDGLTDAQERAGVTPDASIVASSDPLDPDTDGDGLLDGVDPFPPVAAKTIYVKAGTPSPQNGNTWQNAYGQIRTAITRAQDGQATPQDPNDDVSQIWVASGTYKPASKLVPMPLVNNLSIYGGFSGSDGVSFAGETKRGQRNTNPFTNGCVISGDMNGNDSGPIDLDGSVTGNRGDNCPSMLLASTGIDSSALLDGFLITAAYCRQFQTPDDGLGGALQCNGNGYPTIQNCLFLANANQKFGAGAVINLGPPLGKTLLFKNCIFANNVGRGGGGVYVALSAGNRGDVAFDDCQFSQNEARRRTSQLNLEPESVGGAAYVNASAGRVHFNRSAFTGNQARNQGGGIYAKSGLNGYLRVDSCRFRSNTTTISPQAWSFAGAGGGIFLDMSGSVSNSEFWDNRATSNGGGMIVIDSPNTSPNNVAITNCTLVYNRALPTQNFGWDGGGMIVGGGSVAVENTILWQNYFGTGPIPDWDADGAPLERHQIVAAAGTTTLRNCCLNGPGNFSGNGNIHSDPMLDSLELGSLSLGDQSPSIDRGNTFVDLDPILPGFQSMPALDLAGNARVVDGNSDGLEAVDMGAFEAQSQD